MQIDREDIHQELLVRKVTHNQRLISVAGQKH